MTADPHHTLLGDLTFEQREAVVSPVNPLCILAAAGAGKTRVLTRRIAYRVSAGEADPGHVLALTFTRKAAGELSDRLRQLGLRDQVATGTCHAVAAAQLRGYWADRGQQPPGLLDRKSRLLGLIAAERPSLRGVALGELASHIEWAQARLIGPEDFEGATSHRALPVAGEELARLYQRYEHEKRRRRLLDFDDLLSQCAGAIERDPAFAGVQRWRWRHLFVDEFQDLNPLQHRLLQAWMGPSTDLCAVGDPDQAIYGWNGADPSFLARFEHHWPGGQTVRLSHNHRCTPQIVRAAAATLGDTGRDLHSTRADGPAPTAQPYPTEEAEASGVAAQLRHTHASGVPWSQMAVLVRTNAQVIVLRDACVAAGIPVRAPGGVTGLLDQPAVRDFLATLRRQVTQPVAMLIADLEGVRRELEANDARDDDRIALAALADLARQYRRLDNANAPGFLTWLPTALARDAGDSAPPDSVTVCSFHRAKGLEWEAVWLCGLERGLVPIGPAVGEAALAEERRLLYVAATRASQILHCSWSEHRSFGAKAVARDPSPWLHLLCPSVPDGSVVTSAASAESWRHRLREQRRSLAQPADTAVAELSRSGASRLGSARSRPARGTRRSAVTEGWPETDPAIVASLQAWRRTTARASGVPGHVLLHDVTLQALAALRPTTADELLEVPGLGPVKAARYGATLLDLVAVRQASA